MSCSPDSYGIIYSFNYKTVNNKGLTLQNLKNIFHTLFFSLGFSNIVKNNKDSAITCQKDSNLKWRFFFLRNTFLDRDIGAKSLRFRGLAVLLGTRMYIRNVSVGNWCLNL